MKKRFLAILLCLFVFVPSPYPTVFADDVAEVNIPCQYIIGNVLSNTTINGQIAGNYLYVSMDTIEELTGAIYIREEKILGFYDPDGKTANMIYWFDEDTGELREESIFYPGRTWIIPHMYSADGELLVSLDYMLMALNTKMAVDLNASIPLVVYHPYTVWDARVRLNRHPEYLFSWSEIDPSSDGKSVFMISSLNSLLLDYDSHFVSDVFFSWADEDILNASEQQCMDAMVEIMSCFSNVTFDMTDSIDYLVAEQNADAISVADKLMTLLGVEADTITSFKALSDVSENVFTIVEQVNELLVYMQISKAQKNLLTDTFLKDREGSFLNQKDLKAVRNAAQHLYNRLDVSALGTTYAAMDMLVDVFSNAVMDKTPLIAVNITSAIVNLLPGVSDTNNRLMLATHCMVLNDLALGELAWIQNKQRSEKISEELLYANRQVMLFCLQASYTARQLLIETGLCSPQTVTQMEKTNRDVMELIFFLQGCQTIIAPDELHLVYDSWADYVTPFQEEPSGKIIRKNYYDHNGTLIYYDSYAYYDNGLLCSTTLHSVNYMSSGSPYIGTEYTFLYLYDEKGDLKDTVLGALTISDWYNENTGEIILGYEYDTNGKSTKICIYPKTESIEQEKFEVDPSKTEEVYGKTSTISTDTSDGWAAAYLNSVFANEEPTDMTSCRLIYVDSNTIPELWIDYGYGYAGAEVYTTNGNDTSSIYISHGGAEWIENRNLLLVSGGHMDVYYDEVYRIQDGTFVSIGAGDYGAVDSSIIQYDEHGNPRYDYYWAGAKVTQNEYEQNLNAIFDRRNIADIYQNIYTYDQCKVLLQSLISNTTSSATKDIVENIEQPAPPDAEAFGEHHYKFFTLDSVATWEDAKTYCERLGGHLAIITSSEENDFLYQLMVNEGYTNAYFGLTDSYDEGNWIWVDGTDPIYTNWHSGEPNSENSNEDYAMFYWKYSDGTWNDGDFGKRTNKGGTTFICEWNN